MNLRKIIWTLLFWGCALGCIPLNAQIQNAFPGRKTRILFLLDGSGSMLEPMETSNRWSIAITLMSRMIDSLRTVPDLEMGLRVFGHNKPNELRDCNDTKLEVPFGPYNHKEFNKKLKSIKPLGYTSITQSLLATENDFPVDKTARNVVIIITDGVEECPGDPCEVSRVLQKKGIVLRPFIIGLGTDSEKFRTAYSCAGKYFNAEDASQFQKVMGVIVSQVLNNTSAQINLLDQQGRPLETDIPITLYDQQTNESVEYFVHTMNGKGIPDTLYLDPLRKYNMTVHTLPPVNMANIELVGGRHNTIAANTPRGNILLKVGGITRYRQLEAIVKVKDQCGILHNQPFNSTQKYLTGAYDLEVLSVPRLVFKDIQVSQNKTTVIEIPAPGMLQLSLAKDIQGAVFQVKDGKMVWVMDLPTTAGRHELIIQPGNYEVVYRPKSETRTLYTRKKPFSVTSGINTSLSL